MVAANTVTTAYAEAMLVATPAELLLEGKKALKLVGITQEQLAKMEREMASLQGQYKMVEQTYGQDVLNLVLARGYLVKLLDNAAVSQYVQKWHPDVLAEFESIARTAALDH